MKSKWIVAALAIAALLAQGSFAEEKKADAAKPAAKAAEKKADPKDAEALKGESAALLEAFKKKQIDKVLAHYSDKFTSPKLQDKSAVKALLDMADNSGYLDNLEVVDKDSKITVDGDKATIGPIVMKGSFGEATNIFHLQKADGKWLIVGQDLDGVDI